MKNNVYLATVALALSACGQQKERGNEAAASNNVAASEAAQTYSGTGTVTAVDGDQVTVDHGPIEAIGWPAMTMRFKAPPGLASDVEGGSKVRFEFRDEGGTYVLTSIQER